MELELVRSGEDKKDRDLTYNGSVLYEKRVFEHHRIRKDHQVLKNARGDEIMIYFGREAEYKGSKHKFSSLFQSRTKLGMCAPSAITHAVLYEERRKSRFSALDGHEYDMHVGCGFSTETLEIRQTDGEKTGDAVVTISYTPLLKQKASNPQRASFTLHKPELIDEKGQSTSLLDELVAYWFAYECYLYEIRLSQSGVTYGATAMMASGPAAGVC